MHDSPILEMLTSERDGNVMVMKTRCKGVVGSGEDKREAGRISDARKENEMMQRVF